MSEALNGTSQNENFVDANGFKIYYQSFGSGKLLIFLHGEPHPGNLFSTSKGPRFVDLHTCQRGPVEYDIAFIPQEAEALYPGADPTLVHQFRMLMWAGFTTMRWRAWDQFPNRDYWRVEGFKRLQAALDGA